MSLSPSELMALLASAAVLLAMAHGGGWLTERMRLPRVLGEIAGGLLLGPTVLGAILPGADRAITGPTPAVATLLTAVSHVGLLLLMFCSGLEMRARVSAEERKTVGYITVAGSVIPFAAGFLWMQWWGDGAVRGPAGSALTSALVTGLTFAIASIPVIARILTDLRIIDSSFGRIVISAAVIEDIILYVVFAATLGLAAVSQRDVAGLASLIPAEGGSLLWHVVPAIALFALSFAGGPWLFRRLVESPFNVLHRASPQAFLLFWLAFSTCVALALGLNAIFGAFLGGFVARLEPGEASKPATQLRTAAFGTFIPLYFVLIGCRLDLARAFDVRLFCVVFAAACISKTTSIWLGARLAGVHGRQCWNFAIALNARGGPGIVLAAVALEAGLITPAYATILLLTALLTSAAAGAWLAREVRRNPAIAA